MQGSGSKLQENVYPNIRYKNKYIEISFFGTGLALDKATGQIFRLLKNTDSGLEATSSIPHS